MKSPWAKKIALILSFVLLFQFVILSTPLESQAAPAAPELNASSAILIDAASGQVLYEKNADVALPPASMSKMMTEYIVLDYIDSGKISWDDKVMVSKYAADQIGSGGLLAEGETYTVEDMFKNMSIYSGNDASVVLAEYIAGTEESFAHMMNDYAERMGLSDEAHFINATGLSRADLGSNAPTTIVGETLLTARDAGTIAFHIVNDFEDALKYTKMPKEYLRPGDQTSLMENFNWMLEGWKEYNNFFTKYAYEGLDGLKTGYTNEAGYCFTGTAERNGMRLISVVMNTASMEARFVETKKLMDYGFNHFELKTIIAAKSKIDSLPTVKVKKGVETQVEAVIESGISMVVEKGIKDDQFTLTAEALPEDELIAPIEKGDVVGKVTVVYAGTEQAITVNLVASEDVEKAGWFRLFFRGIREFFVDMFEGIKNMF